MVSNELRQLRKGIQKNIAENSAEYTTVRRPVIDDGFGGTIEDPFGAETIVTVKGRVCRPASGPISPSGISVGIENMGEFFFLADWNQDVQEGDVFDYDGIGYRLEKVQTLERFGGVFGYQAKMTVARTVSSGTPVSS